jgi:hypothetical protein
MSSETNTYRLINPYIEGSLSTVINSKNSFRAGRDLYKRLSKHFTNHVENFHMTIQNVETKKLSHFRITEKKKGNSVDFNIVKISDSLPDNMEEKLIGAVDSIEKQGGGKKKKDGESEDSSESSTESTTYLKIPLYPINRFVYFNMPYYKLNIVGMSPLDYSRLFIPMFSLPINPTLEIRMDFYH